MAGPVLDKNGLIYLWNKIVAKIDEKAQASGGDDFEASTTTFSTNAAGDKVITQTFSDRTLVSTMSTLTNGDRQIVETLTKGSEVKTKTTLISKTTGTITETVS